jgi:exodeoxyribonuclease V alpha subunit
MAARQRFCVITGGPGTGKTWTVARLLALLLEQPGAASLRVRLAAPTGKAVARLQESLASALARLDCPDAVKTRLQAKDLTTTLHRLLGTIPNSVKFRHNADHPLPVDVLVVDEASMVSLPLMARLLAALPPAARLILVGDKDQLPPVDPGNVLGDLCQAAAINGFSETFRADYERCGGEALPVATEAGTSGTLLDCVVQLGRNFRSGETAALHAVSAAVNAGDAARSCELLREFTATDAAIGWQPLPAAAQLKDALRTTVISHYGPVLQAASATEALRALGRFRILCAVREGPYGTIAVNRLVEQILGEEGFTTPEAIQRGSYAGKPLMVTANHYLLKLYNGDTGVVGQPPSAAAVPATALVATTNGGQSSLVHFPEETGGLRAIARERLPEHETAYALTIHKSQGSEFDEVLLLLPEATNPVLTRALLYTGLTRAKKVVRLLASEASLRAAIGSPAPRRSGLSDALARPTA